VNKDHVPACQEGIGEKRELQLVFKWRSKKPEVNFRPGVGCRE